jgi:hypothetical protein
MGVKSINQRIVYPNYGVTSATHTAQVGFLSTWKRPAGSSGEATSDLTVTHGDQLTINHVGPWAIQGVSPGSETLTTLNPGSERISTTVGWGRPSWIPGTPYVYNNDPANHGGVVPAGGLVIDGYTVAAGTWVVQFRNFTSNVIVEGDADGIGTAFPGVMFRGCRMRGSWSAPGFINMNSLSPGGPIWLLHCDGGGLGLASGNYCESIFESQGNEPQRDSNFFVIRCSLSRATTLTFLRMSGDAAIENFCREVTDFGTTDHTNGIANGGGENGTLWLRNNMVLYTQTIATFNPNDVIQMAADGGPYMGTFTNVLTGEQGYVIRDNYLGGAAHTLQLGYDKANTVSQVRNVKVTGNKITQQVATGGGISGLAYKTPDFTQYGNVWSGNTWADGPGAGGTIPAPPASNA